MLQGIWSNLTTINTNLSATIITVSVTFIIAVVTVVLGKYYERKVIIETELREKKIPVYEEFIIFFIDILSNKKQYTGDEMERFFVKFTKELIIWGSDEVIHKWSQFRKKLVGNQNQPSAFTNSEQVRSWMLEFEALLLAIRKDIGSKNSKIKSEDIINMFTNDF